MFNKLFKLDQNQASNDVYIWAILSGMLYSGSGLLLTVVCSRCFGGEMTGILTLAMTIGNQLVTIGYWNTRTFQASDIKEKYSFDTYCTLKIFTTIAMIIIAFIWPKIKSYSTEESLAILIMTLFKCGEVVADVFEGRYQQKGRFDISSKSLLCRTSVFLVSFVLMAIITGNAMSTLVVMTIGYFITFCLIDLNLIHYFGGFKLNFKLDQVQSLAISCFPLFINSFLLMYINNAAKLSVQSYQGNTQLAIFNYLFMISFVINAFSNTILKPIINTLSIFYNRKEYDRINKLVIRQILIILGLTVCCLVGGYLIGTQVLSLVYSVDLTPYKVELCICIISGSFTALYQVFQNVLVIMRHQYACLIGCIITAAFTFVITPLCVRNLGISGGPISYLVTMLLMSSIYATIAIYYLRKSKLSIE